MLSGWRRPLAARGQRPQPFQRTTVEVVRRRSHRPAGPVMTLDPGSEPSGLDSPLRESVDDVLR
jgi:hypothetical protein